MPRDKVSRAQNRKPVPTAKGFPFHTSVQSCSQKGKAPDVGESPWASSSAKGDCIRGVVWSGGIAARRKPHRSQVAAQPSSSCYKSMDDIDVKRIGTGNAQVLSDLLGNALVLERD